MALICIRGSIMTGRTQAGIHVLVPATEHSPEIRCHNNPVSEEIDNAGQNKVFINGVPILTQDGNGNFSDGEACGNNITFQPSQWSSKMYIAGRAVVLQDHQVKMSHAQETGIMSDAKQSKFNVSR